MIFVGESLLLHNNWRR